MNNQTSLSVHDNHLGVFETFTLQLVDFNNPTVEMIKSEDIAHALGQICRFGGHTTHYYSVAEHSILVAALAPKELKLEALLHDASEAYVGDVIKPLKNILGNTYAKIEDAFMWAITQKYTLAPHYLDEIKQYDKMALELEHNAYKLDDFKAQGEIVARISKEYGKCYFGFDIKDVFLALLSKYYGRDI